MDPHKLNIDDLHVTTFVPGDGEVSFLLTVGNQLQCTGCDSGCGIMSGDTVNYCY